MSASEPEYVNILQGAQAARQFQRCNEVFQNVDRETEDRHNLRAAIGVDTQHLRKGCVRQQIKGCVRSHVPNIASRESGTSVPVARLLALPEELVAHVPRGQEVLEAPHVRHVRLGAVVRVDVAVLLLPTGGV